MTEHLEHENPLTDTERAELEELRQNKAAEPSKSDNAETSELPNTHWLWLANGEVVEAKGVSGSVEGIPVVAHYAIPDEIVNPVTETHRF